MLVQQRGDLSSQVIPNSNNEIGSSYQKGYPVSSENFPDVISLRQIGEQFTADQEDSQGLYNNTDSQRTHNIFAFANDLEKVFNIECKQITYQLMPAYVFYLSSMRMNINLQRLVHRIQQKDKKYDWLENLTSTVSHEMRTPLGLILQTSQRMANLVSPMDKNIQQLIKMVYYQSQLMLCFVNDLLDLKQMKHGVFKQVISVFDPNEVLLTMMDMFSYQAQAQQIDLELTIKPP